MYQHYDMELLGYKCNMKDIEAALLIPQLERAEERLKRREEICKMMEKGFSNVKNLSFPKVLPGNISARHLFTIWVKPQMRDEIMVKLQEKDIGVAVNYRPIHLMKYYRETYGYEPGMFPEAEKIGESTITLPLYPKLTDEQVHYIIASVKEVVGM
jgi:UDP-4-amino-4-deoxy-L-arabinose-oxoglutarate aminotransferase